MSKAQLRASQIVTTFGPGAMVDLPDDAVIISGLDHWRYDPANIPTITETRLTAKLAMILGVAGVALRTPPPASDREFGEQPNVVAWQFPNWFIVQSKDSGSTSRKNRRRMVHQRALDRGKFLDPDSRERLPVVPVRFVRACPRGHVDDIDWKTFAHQRTTDCARQLWMEESGTSGDLDSIAIACDCGARRPLSHAAQRERHALGFCNGARPWLGGNKHDPARCDAEVRLLIRSASNAYFPQLLSVISIPDAHRHVDDAVVSLWDDFLTDIASTTDLQRTRIKPTPKAALQAFSDNAIMAAIERRRNNIHEELLPVKAVEFEALSEAKPELGSDKPDGDFFARTLPAPNWQGAAWIQAVERVVLVHRLREVVALLGFTRFEAAGPDTQGDLSMEVERAALSLDSSWLPAFENRGEGIFLMFKADTIEQWAKKAKVVERARALEQGFDHWKEDHPGTDRKFPGMAYLMVHSLSHLLLATIAVECGYPASSLRERIYADPANHKYGLLIFTGSSDAEGTLGGLVVAGRSIQQHVLRALEQGTLCSNDPICAYHSPATPDQQPLLGSACHGCLLISETSCEQHNEFLDRALVVPTVEGIGAEFFENIV